MSSYKNVKDRLVSADLEMLETTQAVESLDFSGSHVMSFAACKTMVKVNSVIHKLLAAVNHTEKLISELVLDLHGRMHNLDINQQIELNEKVMRLVDNLIDIEWDQIKMAYAKFDESISFLEQDHISIKNPKTFMLASVMKLFITQPMLIHEKA